MQGAGGFGIRRADGLRRGTQSTPVSPQITPVSAQSTPVSTRRRSARSIDVRLWHRCARTLTYVPPSPPKATAEQRVAQAGTWHAVRHHVLRHHRHARLIPAPPLHAHRTCLVRAQPTRAAGGALRRHAPSRRGTCAAAARRSLRRPTRPTDRPHLRISAVATSRAATRRQSCSHSAGARRRAPGRKYAACMRGRSGSPSACANAPFLPARQSVSSARFTSRNAA